MIRQCRSACAFSLIEVILAIGIISFAMVAILSLLSVGLASSRQSSEDTVIASIAIGVLSGMRGGPAIAAGATTNYYFDTFGQPATNAASGFYDCQVRTRAMAQTEVSSISTNLIAVDLVFTSPSASARRSYTNTVYAALPAGP